MKGFSKVLFCLFPLLCLLGDDELKRNQMISDLDVVKNAFDVRYAPAEWKKIYAGWDLENEIQKAKEEVLSLSSLTAKDYQAILKRFFNSTRDYHVSVNFYSTEAALLPFRVEGVNDRYFVAWVPNDFFSCLMLGIEFKKGDEILEINGQPVSRLIEEIKKGHYGNLDAETDQKLAEVQLTMRLGSKGEDVPQGGNVIVTSKSAKSGKISTSHLVWNYIPEKVMNRPLPAAYEMKFKRMVSPLIEEYQPLYKTLQLMQYTTEDDLDGLFPIGRKKSIIPPLGKILWSSSPNSIFDAAIYKTPSNQKIGFIRIETYVPDDCTEAAKEFATILSFFQKNTDALVIDQTRNGGGNGLYAYALASMLTDRPLTVPMERETLTQQDIFDAAFHLEMIEQDQEEEDFSEEIDGLTFTSRELSGLKNYFQFLINEWTAGRSFTQPTYFFGIEQIQPHPTTNYTRPILFLVDSLSFSCGDFVPAILQDNKRVIVMGTRTAGAGGAVIKESYPSRFGVSTFNFTVSIAYRPDGNPIENLGVTPDILYQPTERDLQHDYSDYRKAIYQALNKLLEKP